MTGYTLTVNVPDKATFDAYYYGYGDVVFMTDMLTPGMITVQIDYGLDLYHLRYQEGRFASGLYFCRVEEYDDSHLPS